MLKLKLNKFYNPKKIQDIFKNYKNKVLKIAESIENKSCTGNEMLGWLDYPTNFNKEEIEKIIKIGHEWNKNEEVKNIVVLAIGGSYIATKAAIDMCLPFYNRSKEIIYISNLSAPFITSVIEKLVKEDFYLVVVSKSGKTLEIAIAFKLFFELLYNKYGMEKTKERIIAITDKSDGKLREIVNKYNLISFEIPKDIGGRFSATTPIGLVPMAIMGLDVKRVLKGCQKAMKDTKDIDIEKNSAYQYAALRNFMYNQKFPMEIFIAYDPNMFFVTEHLKQLFAESEGKDEKGLFPVSSLFTTDLHSVGQYLQQGPRNFFETCLLIKKPILDQKIGNFLSKDDGLDFLSNKTIHEVNLVAAKSTMDAHNIEGKVNIIEIEIEKMDEENFGYLYYWFSKSLAMSALLLGVNPFDQPGVEAYKKRMMKELQKK